MDEKIQAFHIDNELRKKMFMICLDREQTKKAFMREAIEYYINLCEKGEA